MKVTPLDIQKMEFKVLFRGYSRDEVDRFLEDIADTVESLNRENGELRDKVVLAEAQLQDLRKSETALSNTLVSAQTMGEELKQAGQRDAELIVREAELKASEIIREARAELVGTQREVSDLRKQRLVMIERLRSTLRTFERTLEIEEEESANADTTDRAEKIVRDTTL